MQSMTGQGEENKKRKKRRERTDQNVNEQKQHTTKKVERDMKERNRRENNKRWDGTNQIRGQNTMHQRRERKNTQF